MHRITRIILGEEVTVYWNHRVLKRTDGAGTAFEEENLYIVEMYYHNDGKVIGWTEKEFVMGSCVPELEQTLSWMMEALTKPILDEAVLLAEAEAARENGDEDIFPSAAVSLEELLESLDDGENE